MPVSLPPHAVITPLTVEAFGATRQIVGRIEECSFGLESHLGRFLVAERGEEVFSHPTLFQDAAFADRTGGWVVISRDTSRIVMQKWDRAASRIRGADMRAAPFATLEPMSVDAVILLAQEAHRHGGCCQNPSCQGARNRKLDLRRTVLVVIAGRPTAYCSRCYREAQAADPDHALLVVIDGRRLPVRAPVAYLAPTPS